MTVNNEQQWQTCRTTKDGRHVVACAVMGLASSLFHSEPDQTRVKVCPLAGSAC